MKRFDLPALALEFATARKALLDRKLQLRRLRCTEYRPYVSQTDQGKRMCIELDGGKRCANCKESMRLQTGRGLLTLAAKRSWDRFRYAMIKVYGK